MASANGTHPTEQGKKLVTKDYAERVLANLGETRLITDRFLREFGIFDPDGVSIADMRRMRRDMMVKMGLYYSKAPQIRAKWSIKCEDPQIAAAVTEIVRQVRQSWMRTALIKNDFGFQAAVKSYELGKIDATYEDPNSGEVVPVWDDDVVQPVVLGSPIPIPPEHARVALDEGQFDGINTTMKVKDSSENSSHIPADWSLWFVNEFEEEFRDYYGVSRILPCYEPWYAYWFTFHMRSRHVEMDADPALQVWYPPGTYADPNDLDENNQPRVKSNRDAALEIGASLRGGATIAWPSDVYVDEQGKAAPIALWRAEFLKGGENLGAFQSVLDDLQIQKLRGCLVPEEALVATTGGLNSGAKVGSYIGIFQESLEMEAIYLDEIWTKHQIRAIVEANWGKDAPKCELITEGFQEEDMSLVSELIKLAFTADPNALPVKFEELLQRANVPQYTAKEQQDREEAAAEAQQQAQEEQAAAAEEAAAQNALPGEGSPDDGSVGPLPGETPDQLAASQERLRTGPKKYERERIDLSTRRTAPDWAKREGKRRDQNVRSLAQRLAAVAEARYGDAFDAAADAIAETDLELSLGVAGTVGQLIDRITSAIKDRVASWRRPVTGELASLYHTAGAAELVRLGLSADSWDVGRDEVQEWARWRAGELVTTIDQTVVERHIRPWLAKELQHLGQQDRTGVPFGALELAQRLTDHFSKYPTWMAERLVRTEAMMGYNLSALDMWERCGVQEVEAYDGLGGRTGKTDADCLARNGQRYTIDEAREEVAKEHPNGTLGFIPVLASVQLREPDLSPQAEEVLTSLSLYVVTDEGDILSEEDTGSLLAAQNLEHAGART